MTTEMSPPMRVQVTWNGALGFTGRTESGREVALDTRTEDGIRPTEALLLGLGGCMAIDVVSILEKMRCPPASLDLEVEGQHNATPPRAFRRATLRFRLTGDSLPREKVERAVALSKETYCSVLLSLRPDLELDVEIDLRAG